MYGTPEHAIPLAMICAFAQSHHGDLVPEGDPLDGAQPRLPLCVAWRIHSAHMVLDPLLTSWCFLWPFVYPVVTREIEKQVCATLEGMEVLAAAGTHGV